MVESKCVPHSLQDVQHIYGLLSSFYTFILRIAQIVEPISQLLQNDELGTWTPRHDAIVEKVLNELTMPAGLRILDPNVPFVLEGYATPGSYGGVLY